MRSLPRNRPAPARRPLDVTSFVRRRSLIRANHMARRRILNLGVRDSVAPPPAGASPLPMRPPPTISPPSPSFTIPSVMSPAVPRPPSASCLYYHASAPAAASTSPAAPDAPSTSYTHHASPRASKRPFPLTNSAAVPMQVTPVQSSFVLAMRRTTPPLPRKSVPTKRQDIFG